MENREPGKRKRNNGIYVVLSTALAVAVICGGVFSGSRLYDVIAAEETSQAVTEASAEQGDGGEAAPQVQGTSEGYQGPMEAEGAEVPSFPEIEQQSNLPEQKVHDGDTFRIVCIGNSVTQHPYVAQNDSPEGYWLQDWGMAASAREKDYAHVLEQKMVSIYGETSLEVYNYNAWETAEASGIPRSTLLPNLDPLFEGEKGADTDLIILQLGESCTMFDNLMQDYIDLINYVHSKAPNAAIGVTATVIIMDEVRNAAVDNIKQMICQSMSLPYISMSGYNESMWVGEGTVIYNEQGEATVMSFIQRTHPGDSGMQYIADQIYTVMKPYLPVVG